MKVFSGNLMEFLNSYELNVNCNSGNLMEFILPLCESSVEF